MPYVVSFSKAIQVADPGRYINECCVGGDVVLDRLLHELRSKYGADLVSNQEDWGWFSWFEESGIKLAVDVHTDDPTLGEFRVHLTSSKPRFLLGAKIQDTPELVSLRELVVSQLQEWPVEHLKVEHADEKFMPTGSAV